MKPQEPNRIREIRLSKGMTLQEVADKTGITTDPAQIQKLERGLRSLTPKWMKVISKALDVNAHELLPQDWQPEVSLRNMGTVKMPIIAAIREGVWQQGLKVLPKGAGLLFANDSAEAERPNVFTNRPAHFNENQIFAVEVEDAGAQTVYPRGTVLVCAKKNEYGAIENGKYVVCAKTNAQMQATQLFIRRYVKNDGQDLLFNDVPGMPEVDMPKKGELEILGIIIKSIRDE